MGFFRESSGSIIAAHAVLHKLIEDPVTKMEWNPTMIDSRGQTFHSIMTN